MQLTQIRMPTFMETQKTTEGREDGTKSSVKLWRNITYALLIYYFSILSQILIVYSQKTSRNKSLLEMHADTEAKSKSKRSKEDDESHIIWDHARDMSLGGKLMDEKQRSKLISDAKSLGDRFGGSKAGGYL